MKKNVLILIAAVLGLGLWSCKDDDEDAKNVANLVITVDNIADNVVTLSATADNAITYSWDFGNGEVGDGSSVTVTYKMAGTYEVKCTANGQIDNMTATKEVTVETGDPSVYNPVALLLTGYELSTGDSKAVWRWAGNGSQPNDFGYWSSGPKEHVYGKDSADLDWQNAFDDSWWKLGEYDGVVREEMLDDRYSFKLNQSFDYKNSYKESGFMWNWAWANYKFNAGLDVWDDNPLMQGDSVASWSLEVIDHADYPNADSIPKTVVSGKEVAKSYIIHLTGNAYLGVGAASNDYQICRIDSDTLWIRYDNTYPQDLPIKDEWAEEGIALDDPEWGYFYLVRADKE